MSLEPIPLKVTNSFYYIKDSVKPKPYVKCINHFGNSDNEVEPKSDNPEKGNHMSFLDRLKKHIKE